MFGMVVHGMTWATLWDPQVQLAPLGHRALLEQLDRKERKALQEPLVLQD